MEKYHHPYKLKKILENIGEREELNKITILSKEKRYDIKKATVSEDENDIFILDGDEEYRASVKRDSVGRIITIEAYKDDLFEGDIISIEISSEQEQDLLPEKI